MTGIRKIAREAGVSPASVSRVLSNDSSFSVSKQTRARIKKVAAKYNYHPHLNRPVTPPITPRSILVLTTHSLETEAHDPYFIQVHDGIIQEASKQNIQIKAFVRFPNKAFQFTDAQKYDGVIVAGVFTQEFYANLAKNNPHIVLIDDYRYLPAYDIIRNSYFEATQIVLDQLLENGLNKIAFIGGNIHPMNNNGETTDSYQDIRAKAYLMWTRLHNISPLIALNGWTPKDGFDSMNTLLKDNFQAALIASDQLTIGAYRALKQHQLKVPQDLQIISYNDSDIAEYLVPSLSSINPASLSMGTIAVQRLVHCLNNPNDIPIHINLPAKATWRESSEINLN